MIWEMMHCDLTVILPLELILIDLLTKSCWKSHWFQRHESPSLKSWSKSWSKNSLRTNNSASASSRFSGPICFLWPTVHSTRMEASSLRVAMIAHVKYGIQIRAKSFYPWMNTRMSSIRWRLITHTATRSSLVLSTERLRYGTQTQDSDTTRWRATRWRLSASRSIHMVC